MTKTGVGALLILAALTGNSLATESYDPARSFRERVGGERMEYQRVSPAQDYIERFSGVSVPPGHSVMHQTQVNQADIDRAQPRMFKNLDNPRRHQRDYYAKVRSE
ncbi:hypothetical protein [Beijerinckia indica]|uniref:Uncharacterized protein n=1 Tax=Beijerinckia indica subsp. indica (strain ATCC 9039 / DSM 1715 / NCIMB 8712) TaxID=395963 RepID=B2IHF1_BEII9|nr:hypothetical protein [Beijerinckia indica]ACB95936.1 hypothetical protein Bind_2323 [Beijerinckia indica subsp. indica ATCC 9039]